MSGRRLSYHAQDLGSILTNTLHRRRGGKERGEKREEFTGNFSLLEDILTVHRRQARRPLDQLVLKVLCDQFLEHFTESWRKSVVVKSSSCSCRGPGFGS